MSSRTGVAKKIGRKSRPSETAEIFYDAEEGPPGPGAIVVTEALQQPPEKPVVVVTPSVPISTFQFQNTFMNNAHQLEFGTDSIYPYSVATAVPVHDPASPTLFEALSLSSLSSQNSMPSGEYIHQTILKMENSRECQQRVMQQQLVLPKDEQRLLETFCKHQIFYDSLKYVLGNSFQNFCLAHGVQLSEEGQDNDDVKTARELFQRIQTEDVSVLFARVGHQLVDQLCAKASTDETVETNVAGGDVVAMSHEAAGADTQPLLASNPDNEIPMDCDMVSVSTVNASVSQPQLENPPRNETYISPSTLEAAYDKIKLEDEKAKAIHQSGKILYDFLFSETEKQRCTFGGRNKTTKFDSDKVRQLNRTLAWMFYLKVNEPQTPRTFEAFQADAKKEDRRLSRTDQNTLELKVLKEYAYQKRKK